MTQPGTSLFADETKAGAYVMVAAAVATDREAVARRELRRMLMPGQTSIHFRSEGDRRRRSILDVIAGQGWSASVLVVRMKDQRQDRDLCLDRLTEMAAERGARRLVLETDDSLVTADRRLLFSAARRHGVAEGFEYQHRRRREEPCLWVPDALAWCYARGGEWRRRTAHLVSEVVELA